MAKNPALTDNGRRVDSIAASIEEWISRDSGIGVRSPQLTGLRTSAVFSDVPASSVIPGPWLLGSSTKLVKAWAESASPALAGAGFTVFDMVRSDDGFWAHPANMGSLPLGIMTSARWARRITGVTVYLGVTPMCVADQLLVRIDVAAKPPLEGRFKCTFVDLTIRGPSTREVTIQGGRTPVVRDVILIGTSELCDDIRSLGKTEQSIKVQYTRRIADLRKIRLSINPSAISRVRDLRATLGIWVVGQTHNRGISCYLPDGAKTMDILRALSTAQASIILESPRWLTIMSDDMQPVLAKLTEWRRTALGENLRYRSWRHDRSSGFTWLSQEEASKGAMTLIASKVDPRLQTDDIVAFLEVLEISDANIILENTEGGRRLKIHTSTPSAAGLMGGRFAINTPNAQESRVVIFDEGDPDGCTVTSGRGIAKAATPGSNTAETSGLGKSFNGGHKRTRGPRSGEGTSPAMKRSLELRTRTPPSSSEREIQSRFTDREPGLKSVWWLEMKSAANRPTIEDNSVAPRSQRDGAVLDTTAHPWTPGNIVRAPSMDDAQSGDVPLRLLEEVEHGWKVLRADNTPPQTVVKRQTDRRGDNWVVQTGEGPTKWFSLKQHNDAEQKAREWAADYEKAGAAKYERDNWTWLTRLCPENHLIRTRSHPRYSLNKARKCGDSETVVFKMAHNLKNDGSTEAARRIIEGTEAGGPGPDPPPGNKP